MATMTLRQPEQKEAFAGPCIDREQLRSRIIVFPPPGLSRLASLTRRECASRVRAAVLQVACAAMASCGFFASNARTACAEQGNGSKGRAVSKTAQAKPATPGGSAAAVSVFRKACLECHDDDGRGEIGRDLFPQIPDFTNARWQASRSDSELSHSIVEGKGKGMPRMRSKLGSVDPMQIVAFVRAFRGGKQVIDDDPDPPRAPAAPGQADPHAGESVSALPAPLPSNPLSTREGGRLFQRFCVKCHGADAKGTQARESEPNIPDFTNSAWHKSRRDSQLAVSVLDGKGNGMPPFRGKLSATHVRDLVVYIRSVGPTEPRPAGTHSGDFDALFQQLEDELENQRRQFKTLSPMPRAPSGTTMK
jgi:mono/diheme cytochrome c family protein